MLGVPGIAGCSGDRVVAEYGCAGRELRHVKARDVEGAGGIEPFKHMRCVVGPVIRENAGAAGTDLSLAVEHVFVGERHAVQGPAHASSGMFFVCAFGRGQGGVGLAPDDGTVVPAERGDSVQTHARHVARAEAAIGDAGRHLSQTQTRDFMIVHGCASSSWGNQARSCYKAKFLDTFLARPFRPQ